MEERGNLIFAKKYLRDKQTCRINHNERSRQEIVTVIESKCYECTDGTATTDEALTRSVLIASM